MSLVLQLWQRVGVLGPVFVFRDCVSAARAKGASVLQGEPCTLMMSVHVVSRSLLLVSRSDQLTACGLCLLLFCTCPPLCALVWCDVQLFLGFLKVHFVSCMHNGYG